MSLTKSDIVDAIAKKTSLTKTDSQKSLEAFIDVVKEALKKGNDVPLIGFLTFKVVPTKARTAKNPRTGKEIKVPAGKKVKVVVGKGLKEVVKK